MIRSRVREFRCSNPGIRTTQVLEEPKVLCSSRVNFVENLVDGNRLLPVLLQDLESAARCIHITVFLFFDDSIGEEISGKGVQKVVNLLD